MTDKNEQARLLATFIHFGQKRQDGENYINHPKRMVLEYIRTLPNIYNEIDSLLFLEQDILTHEQENMICAIWLHDCIEDSPIGWEINEFILNVFGYDIWDIVINLTYDPKLGSYNEYITLVFQHPTAWKIKLIDMIDNTSYIIPKEQKQKYYNACMMLMLHGVTVPEILKERLNL